MSFLSWFEKTIVRALSILLIGIITVATLWLIYRFIIMTWDRLLSLESTRDLQEGVQDGMAGIFVVLIGLELLETLKAYAAHRRFRLEVVLVVGAIAVARHLIQLDFHHVDGLYLGGFGMLIVALVGGYYVLQKVPRSFKE